MLKNIGYKSNEWIQVLNCTQTLLLMTDCVTHSFLQGRINKIVIDKGSMRPIDRAGSGVAENISKPLARPPFSHLYPRPAGALAARHLAVVVDRPAGVAVARLAPVGVGGEAVVLGQALVAVPSGHVALARAFAWIAKIAKNR